MKQVELKYGCNPNQKPAHLDLLDGGDLPFEILSGRPGCHQGLRFNPIKNPLGAKRDVLNGENENRIG